MVLTFFSPKKLLRILVGCKTRREAIDVKVENF